MVIEHFSHKHMLSPREKKREEKIECVACHKYCDEGLIYCCRAYFCRFKLHESCAKLPQELHNPLFHPHPLSLVRSKHGCFSCDACGLFRSGFSFRCSLCEVNLDVKCAFIWPAVEGDEAVVVGTHFSHRQHPLVAWKNITACRFTCEVCKTNRSDPMIYGCLPCGFFLHPSCFKLPKEVFHPFHPYHPLTLKRIKKQDYYVYGRRRLTIQRIKDDDNKDDEDDDDVDVTGLKCNACREDMAMATNHFAYFYWHRNNYTFFCLGTECASVIMPAITYEGHDHLLQFRDNIVDELIKCSACNSTISESYAFRCLDLACDFNLHLTCGPLPSTIQHQSHIDPLIFTICPIEDEKDCEPDEFYCDACEEQRVDRLLPIYYCKKCHFVAEISCVISEVLSSLKGERGDVELRNPFGQFGNLIREKQEQLVINPALTLSDIFNSLGEAEKKELSNAFLSARALPRSTSPKWETSIVWEYREVPFKGDEAYTQFMKFADIGLEIPIEFGDTKEDVQISNFKFCYTLLPKEEVVDIEDYKITRKLAPILKGLLSKYGDVSAQSNLSPKVKLYFFLMLCDCIYSMIHTKVVDITKKDLLNWWASLETSKYAGFRIQFAFDHLKRVALAHFGLYGKKQGNKALAQLDRDIEALKEKRKFITSIKSSLIEECSREVSILQGGKAGLGLL